MYAISIILVVTGLVLFNTGLLLHSSNNSFIEKIGELFFMFGVVLITGTLLVLQSMIFN